MPCMFLLRRRPNARTGLAPTPAFEVTYRAALGQRDINPALLDLTIDSDDEEPAYEDSNQPIISQVCVPNAGRTGPSDRKPRRPSVFDAPQLLITPRMAAKMYWRCHSLVEIMEHRTAVNTAYIASLLPAEAQWVARNDSLWWDQFGQSLRHTLERLSQVNCTESVCL